MKTFTGLFNKWCIIIFVIFISAIFSPLNAQWRDIGISTTGQINSFAVSGSNLFVASSGDGVFRSSDNGTSWTAVSTGLTNHNISTLTVSGSNLFAGTSGGVFLSTNNGTNWTAVNTGLTDNNVNTLAVSGSNLFAGTIVSGVFRSTNNGASWNALHIGSSSTSAYSLAVSGSNLFAAMDGSGVYLSTNSGTSWTAVNTGLTNYDVHTFAVSGGNLFVGMLRHGVYLSTNSGTSWTAVNTGLTNQNIHTLAVSGTYIFAGTDLGVFLSTNNGTSWTNVSGAVLMYNGIYSLSVIGSDLFAGTRGRGAYRKPLSEMVIKTITASAGTNGTFIPSGALSVVSAEDQSFLIRGNNGYRVLDVLVDGTSVGVVNSYNFTNVTANHTISATFIPEMQATSPSFGNISTSSFNVSFTPSLDGGEYIVARRAGSVPNFTPADSRIYVNGSGFGADTIVYVGAGTNFTETGRSVNVDYYYKIFNYHGTDYSTQTPLLAINRIMNTNSPNVDVPATGTPLSEEFPNAGVSVIFPNGNTGTTLTVTKDNSGNTGNFMSQGGLSFTVTSSNPSPGAYTVVLDFSSLSLTNWDNYKVYKRHDENSPWQDVTQEPINAVITNRTTDGIPGKFTITGLTSFSQFALQGTVTSGGITQSVTMLNPSSGELVRGGDLYSLAWRSAGFINGDKMEYTTDDGNTWQQILPDGVNQMLIGLTQYPWPVPKGINSSKCRVRVSSWNNPSVFGISELFTIWNVNFTTPSAGDKLYSGSVQEIKWNGDVPGGASVLFSSNGGSNWAQIGETSNNTSNTVVWTVPDITSGNCQITVKSKSDANISSKNNLLFSVDRMLGDVNANGNIETADAVEILQNYVGLVNFDRRTSASADVNVDNSVNLTDAYYVLYKSVNGNYPADATLHKTSMYPSEATIGTEELKADNIVSIPVNIKNSSDTHTLEIELEMDNSLASLQNVTNKLPEGWILSRSEINGKLKIVMIGLTALNEGTALSLDIKLKGKSQSAPMKGTITINGEIKKAINSGIGILPTEFSMSQNYPNPFNPTTMIKYSIPGETGHAPSLQNVALKVYDMLGREVATIVNEQKGAGNYEVKFNAGNLSSGVYFYQLRAGSFVQTKKLILMK